MITAEEQKLRQAIVRGARIMVDHGLGHWKMGLNNKRKALAETYYNQQTIKLSKHFVMIADEDQFVGITLHEVTHALLGPNEGHNHKFVELCTKISPNALYARRSVNIPVHKFKVSCDVCGLSGGVNKMMIADCARCYREGKISKLKVEPNPLKVVIW